MGRREEVGWQCGGLGEMDSRVTPRAGPDL